jgi:hypothetical protein
LTRKERPVTDYERLALEAPTASRPRDGAPLPHPALVQARSPGSLSRGLLAYPSQPAPALTESISHDCRNSGHRPQLQHTARSLGQFAEPVRNLQTFPGASTKPLGQAAVRVVITVRLGFHWRGGSADDDAGAARIDLERTPRTTRWLKRCLLHKVSLTQFEIRQSRASPRQSYTVG